MSRRAPMALLGAAVLVVAGTLSCGDVPTLANGVAYYTPVLLPLPAVAAGDTLRDSLGRPAPLRVRAFTRDSQEITGLPTTFVPASLPSDVTIDANGILVARDTLRSVSLVGQLDGRLQTSPVTLQIVPEPSTMARVDNAAGDTAFAAPAVKACSVSVTGIYRGTSTAVNGILVRYRIDSLRPAGLPPGSATLIVAGGGSLRPDSTIAVDTTKASGISTRSVLVIGGSGVQRVYISASARRLRDATPLAGSPVRFTLDIKP